MAFHDAFMKAVRTHGRVHEIEMIGRYKIKSKTFFEELELGRELFARGRIRIIPERIRGLKEVREILDRPLSEA
jgi:heterodisulfide reductase subunit C/quinone-modifying oxidoreductase subunit QmoC